MYRFQVSPLVKGIIVECMSELKQLGVPISNSIYFMENRGYSRYGTCTLKGKCRRKGFEYRITINKFLVENCDIRNTVAHELLHTVDNSNATYHAGEWRKWANYLNRYRGYDIRVRDRKQLSNGAYTRKKVFSIDQYDPSVMDVIECPICHIRACLRKGVERDRSGGCKYVCRKCRKPMIYVDK